MFTDLRQFEYAKEFLSSSDQRNVKQLIKKQAEWCRTTNDPKAAAYVFSLEYSTKVFQLDSLCPKPGESNISRKFMNE